MRLLAFCLMPNHWHLVLWPSKSGELSAYMKYMTTVHVRRHQARYGTWGLGHVYQGRFKSFPIETDHHLLMVLRYVEANAAKASLVRRAEDWPWSSLVRQSSDDGRPLVVPGPVERPGDWLARVNQHLEPNELFEVRRALARQLPFGAENWAVRLKETGVSISE